MTTTTIEENSAEFDHRLSVSFQNTIEDVKKLHRVMEIFGKQNELPPRTQMHMTLALEELVSNTIFYGFNDDKDHQILLHLTLEEGVLNAKIEDDGSAFNPLEAPEADTEKGVEEREIGGLGIHFVKELMDGIKYSREDEHNILVLEKKV